MPWILINIKVWNPQICCRISSYVRFFVLINSQHHPICASRAGAQRLTPCLGKHARFTHRHLLAGQAAMFACSSSDIWHHLILAPPHLAPPDFGTTWFGTTWFGITSLGTTWFGTTWFWHHLIWNHLTWHHLILAPPDLAPPDFGTTCTCTHLRQLT